MVQENKLSETFGVNWNRWGWLWGGKGCWGGEGERMRPGCWIVLENLHYWKLEMLCINLQQVGRIWGTRTLWKVLFFLTSRLTRLDEYYGVTVKRPYTLCVYLYKATNDDSLTELQIYEPFYVTITYFGNSIWHLKPYSLSVMPDWWILWENSRMVITIMHYLVI